MSPLSFPPKIALAQTPTPLDRLERADVDPYRLWCKRDDLTGCALSGNKVRKLEFVFSEALSQGADTLITCGGLQSNHCRATALIAAAWGLNCRLVLRGEPEQVYDGNLLLGQLAGAQIACFSEREYRKKLPELLAHQAHQVLASGGKPYVIPTGASDAVGLWGYVAAAKELAEDFHRCQIKQPLVVCAAGSGGTLAGLAAGLSAFLPTAEVLGIAVCDSAEYFRQRVYEDVSAAMERYPGCGLKMPENFTVVDDYIGPGYALVYPEVTQAIAEAAQSSGLMLDPVYTGKAYFGMLEQLRQRAFAPRDVVFVHTGGIFGLFPYKHAF